jgi:hypothetical protein
MLLLAKGMKMKTMTRRKTKSKQTKQEGTKKICGPRLKVNKRNKSWGKGKEKACGGGQVSNKRPYFKADLNEGLKGGLMELSGCSKWLSSF